MDQIRESQIDDYLLGRLKGAEKTAFEESLAHDPELAREVEVRMELIRGIGVLGQQELRQRLGRIRQEALIDQRPAARRLPLRRWLAVAAAVAAIAAAAFWLFGPASHSEDLFAAYYTPYDISTGARSAEENRDILEARRLYAGGHYREAIPILENLPSPENPQLGLILGICYLETDQYPQAEASFRRIIGEKTLLFTDQARWYLALSYLKQGETSLSIEQLQPLADDPGADHHEEAVMLMKKVK